MNAALSTRTAPEGAIGVISGDSSTKTGAQRLESAPTLACDSVWTYERVIKVVKSNCYSRHKNGASINNEFDARRRLPTRCARDVTPRRLFKSTKRQKVFLRHSLEEGIRATNITTRPLCIVGFLLWAVTLATINGCSSTDRPAASSTSAAPTSTPTVTVPGTPTVTVQIGTQSGTVALTPGMTFGGSTLNPVTSDPIALKSATQLLTDRFPFQNQWSGGFGVDSDQQWPTQASAYNWTELDARINLILSTGRTPVITLCGVPAWMRVTPTDYFGAPQAIYFQAYANYAAAIATRYPEVKYFLVWSEMKGFWNANLMRWDYEGYTNFYNDIYAALKAVSPTIQVGGPYVNMSNFYGADSGGSALTGSYGTIKQNALDVVTYWLANNQGADFLVVDGSVMGNNNTEAPADWYAANQYFSDVNTWLKQHSSLPIWWSEYYPNPCLYSNCAPYVAIFDHDQQNTLLTKTLLSMMPDVSVALKWTPDGASTTKTDLPAPYQIPTGPYPNMGDQSSVWSDTTAADGGRGFPFADSLAQLEQYFSPGSTLYSTQVSNSNVAAYATSTSIALINQTSQNQIAQVTRGTSTQTIQLGAYQVYINSMP